MPKEQEKLPDGSRIIYYHARRISFTPPPTMTMVNWRKEVEMERSIRGAIPKLEPMGGRTQAILLDAEGNELASAFAECSDKEHYNKKIGREIARGRLIKKLADYEIGRKIFEEVEMQTMTPAQKSRQRRQYKRIATEQTGGVQGVTYPRTPPQLPGKETA